MDIRKIKKLIDIMVASDVTEIEVTEGDQGVRINRGAQGANQYNPVVTTTAEAAAPATTPLAAEPFEAAQNVSTTPPTGHVISAPMVGTFYRAPSPGSPPFLEIGDRVREGDTMCIIESMKMMNQIKADKSGKIEAILVENDTAVEFDQPLFTIVMRRVLIANRGEIALRIARTCSEMGLETVAAYSQIDRHALHLDLVDEVICIGQRSYLSVNDLVMAGRVTGCDAVHPGYGFLSENAAFCRAVTSAGMPVVRKTGLQHQHRE